MTIKINFLGTSQAIPTAKRNHTSILLQYKEENILIDCGEGTQRQFRKAKLNPCKITKILITHWHGDHILGLPGLLQTLLLNQYSKKLFIYGPKRTKENFEKMIKLLVPYNSIPIEFKEVTDEVFIDENEFSIETKSLKHSIPCNAYSFYKKPKLRLHKDKLEKLKVSKEDLKKLKDLKKGKDIKINNKLIKSKNYTYLTQSKKISFIFDTALIENCYKISEKSDLLITEAVYTNKEKDLAKLHEHLTSEQAAKIAKKTKSKKLVFAHLSQRYDNSEDLILNEAKPIFKETSIAEDLMTIQI